jgi:hypothetical protein
MSTENAQMATLLKNEKGRADRLVSLLLKELAAVGISHPQIDALEKLAGDERTQAVVLFMMSMLECDAKGHAVVPGADVPRFDSSVATFKQLFEKDDEALSDPASTQTQLAIWQHMVFILGKRLKDLRLLAAMPGASAFAAQRGLDIAQALSVIDVLEASTDKLEQFSTDAKRRFARSFYHFATYLNIE